MTDDWRACISLGGLPPSLHSFRQALLPALRDRLGDQADQIAVSSSVTRIFLYAPSVDLADEAAQVAREVLHAPVQTEGWDWREQQWRDADAIPADRNRAEGHAYSQQQELNHASRQEYERSIAANFGLRRWQVRVELPSHREVVALAGHLAAQGWRVRRRIRTLIVWADCEDDARGLFRALSGDGDGGADAAMAIRAGRVSLRYLEVWPGGEA